MDRRLYEASLCGSVLALNKLMQEDELILDRVSVTCFHETPLHIAAMRGHVGFTQALLIRKPKLATELDSLGHSPLHLASIEGHVEVVRELVHVNIDVCDFRDLDGRTPLHLAAIKGRVGVIEELTRTRPKSAHERLGRGETVLHLCVRYYRLEALKYLVESTGDKDLVNSIDQDGNTILHLAAIFKQMETIEYLFSRKEVKENANVKNVNGSTALDVLDHCPRDVKVMEIREFLVEAGVKRGMDLIETVPPSSSSCMNFPSPLKNPWQFISTFWKKYFLYENNWLEESRGNLMIVATVTATMSFQAGLNPPGNVWQEDNDGRTTPGTAIMDGSDSENGEDFKLFLKYNTVSLLASLSIILLMISGIPLKNKLSMCLLVAAMSTSVAFMALTYVQSITLIAPESTKNADISIYLVSVWTWYGLCGIVILINTINIVVWLVVSGKFQIGKRRPKCGACQGIYENWSRKFQRWQICGARQGTNETIPGVAIHSGPNVDA
ncbi:ankyrin repeat-containing protein BDA1-like [Cornus florida]|uniref:ankyrin repeat-containing protein BDA1-like n=1 Tax=Cornus florida TaxID=4283 RepID=UPI0028A1B614|nr:ankyrin repeat-containing protein BDA1-like [Cornus florida]